MRATSWIRGIPASRSARAVMAGLALLPITAFCEDAPDVLTDSFSIQLGTFLVAQDTTIRFDGSAGEQGTPIDLNRTIGKGDQSRIRLDAFWRFGDSQRHKVRAMVFDYSRNTSRTISEEIDYGGVIYPIDAKVDFRNSFSIYELAYEYSFLRRENYELSASFGVHYANFKLRLSATETDPETSEIVRLSSEGSVGAPLPVFGLRGTWALPHDLSIDASGQFFALSIDQYDGNLQDYRALLNWQPKKWLGVGIGYDYFKVDVTVNGDKFDGQMNWTYHGPMIFYSASF
jgi:hypothetical protein